jgi:hypothetical protein
MSCEHDWVVVDDNPYETVNWCKKCRVAIRKPR